MDGQHVRQTMKQRKLRTHHINKLGQLQSHFDRQPVRVVAHWPDKGIVSVDEVVIKSFGVGIRISPSFPACQQYDQDQEARSHGSQKMENHPPPPLFIRRGGRGDRLGWKVSVAPPRGQ
ncbi:hypothetical protein CEXT_411911 [Caerostris extrusa]|uniref:Transposase n=1 Tax=Caerostris extrusa TaxID=172846 RepID=A0AAV4SSA2_CAEEX|nr:hypothetical protein CEXT_411911 [Caerostris extrusa]